MPAKTPVSKKEKRSAVKTVMTEYKSGKLHSGSKTGPKVKNPKQAIAIALSEAGLSKSKRSKTP